jgi:class 3 adenylate cyclase
MHRAGGREVDARADEFFAVFDRASAALEAALAIERSLRERTWPEGVDVRVRAGIHSGRPTLTDSGYVGLAVHTVARISSAAHGGQILLSAAARNAVGRIAADPAYASVGWARIGSAALREPLPVFQVEAPGPAGALSAAADPRRSRMASPTDRR